MAAPPPTPATITITECIPHQDNTLYDVTFNDHHIITTVTSDPTTASTWLTNTNTTPPPHLVGLDIEWRPNRSKQSDNPVATLQLCVGPTCLIFQLLHSPPPSPPAPLLDFLSSGSHTFVGVGIESDVERLICDHGLSVRNRVDLAELGFEKGVVSRNGVGLKELSRIVMGVEVVKPKSVTMSRWDSEWLSYQQIQYACVDAYLSYEIGSRLLGSGSG